MNPVKFARMIGSRLLLMMMTAMMAISCSAEDPINPSFPITISKARHLLRDDIDHPHPLQRPLLIVGGFLDPGIAPHALRKEFTSWTGDSRVISVTLFWDTSFEQCRRDIIAAVDTAFPSTDPEQTTEVDVVGFSMGGLAARYAAAIEPAPDVHPVRRLKIARLFTISSPLRGALRADSTSIDLNPLQGAMRYDSPMIHWLNTRPLLPQEMYALYSYTRLRDTYVGTVYAALPGQTAWWVAPPPLDTPHGGAFHDARILADIACRLRGENPLAHDPPAPLPGNK
jgi:pimeloyl-ACP methyl ester carboxylesterase